MPEAVAHANKLSPAEAVRCIIESGFVPADVKGQPLELTVFVGKDLERPLDLLFISKNIVPKEAALRGRFYVNILEKRATQFEIEHPILTALADLVRDKRYQLVQIGSLSGELLDGKEIWHLFIDGEATAYNGYKLDPLKQKLEKYGVKIQMRKRDKYISMD